LRIASLAESMACALGAAPAMTGSAMSKAQAISFLSFTAKSFLGRRDNFEGG
jgi:hypothetical protein